MTARDVVDTENRINALVQRHRTLTTAIPKKVEQLEQARRDCIRLEAEIRADEANLRAASAEVEQLRSILIRLRARPPDVEYRASAPTRIPANALDPRRRYWPPPR